MANHSEVTKDDVIIVKLEEDVFPESAENNNNNIEKLRFEKELLRREKENAELQAALKEMKYEKEKFENKYEMEKLKSENAMLKAELNVKTLSDNKRRIEEELESMTSKKAKLDEEQTKSQAEIAILKENSEKLQNDSQKLQENYEKLKSEKSNLDKLYRDCKRDKENALKQKKTTEDMLKAANQRLRENNQTPRKTVVSLKSNTSVRSLRKVDEIDYSRMGVECL